MITVTRTYLPDYNVYANYLSKIWVSGQLTNNGIISQELGKTLQNYLGVPNLSLVANGTLALQLAIKAFDLKGEIITTPYSYVATTNAILWEGCDPVFVDIDPNTYCIDPNLIEEAITDRTSAILATHVYGYPCDVIKIQEIAERHGLKVIYDDAHSFGVKLNGKSLLNYGDCSALSFHATKLFHTAEGGAVICKDPQTARRVFIMSKFGHVGEDDYLEVGINAKMSELHAAMGLALLPKVPDIIIARKQCSMWYNELLMSVNLRRPLAKEGVEHNYAYYPVVFSSHKAMIMVRAALQKEEIYPRRYFYPSLNTLPFLRDDLRRPCPVSESLADRVLCLPMFTNLCRDDIERITSCIIQSIASEEGTL